VAKYLTLGQAADRLGVVAATAKKWLKKLKPKKVGRELQYDSKTFEQWFKNMPERPKIGRPPGSGKKARRGRKRKVSTLKVKATTVKGPRGKRGRRKKAGRRGKKLAMAGPSLATQAKPKATRKKKKTAVGRKKPVAPTRTKKPAAKKPAESRASLPIPMDAVSASKFAQLVGCSGPSIYNWIKDGMPATEVAKAKRTSYFVSPKEAAGWLKRNGKIGLVKYAELAGGAPSEAPAPEVEVEVEVPAPVTASASTAAPFVPLSPIARELLKQEQAQETPPAPESGASIPVPEAVAAASEVSDPFQQMAAALTEALSGPGLETESKEAPELPGRTFAQVVEEAEAVKEEREEPTERYEHLLAGCRQDPESDDPATPGLLEEEKQVVSEESSDTMTPEDLLSMNDAQVS